MCKPGYSITAMAVLVFLLWQCLPTEICAAPDGMRKQMGYGIWWNKHSVQTSNGTLDLNGIISVAGYYAYRFPVLTGFIDLTGSTMYPYSAPRFLGQVLHYMYIKVFKIDRKIVFFQHARRDGAYAGMGPMYVHRFGSEPGLEVFGGFEMARAWFFSRPESFFGFFLKAGVDVPVRNDRGIRLEVRQSFPLSDKDPFDDPDKVAEKAQMLIFNLLYVHRF